MENLNKSQVMSMMNSPVGDNLGVSVTTDYISPQESGMTCWGYWRDYYYPHVIKETYPVYIQEKSIDKGKQAFEILKVLKDKNIIKVDKVGDFINAMDEIIKIL